MKLYIAKFFKKEYNKKDRIKTKWERYIYGEANSFEGRKGA